MPYSKTRKIIQRGTRANQPAATSVQEGTIYYVTNEFVTERSNGTTWDNISDLEVGSDTWTPVVTFDTPGDLSVVYSTQDGSWLRQGRLVKLDFNIITSTFIHSTASGNLKITGNPFTNLVSFSAGTAKFSGITKVGYTDFIAGVDPSGSVINMVAGGSGVVNALVTAADVPSGGTFILMSSIILRV
jgi:hypothetical protein